MKRKAIITKRLLILAWILCWSLVNGVERTPKGPVVDEPGGSRVANEWFDNGSDPRGREWTVARNRQARAVLDKLPTRPWVEDRLKRLLTEPATNYHSLSWRRGRFFLVKSQSPSEKSVLITLVSITNLNSERIILDPNYGSLDNSNTLRWYAPSLDGTLVAVCLSENRRGDGKLYIYETATGQRQSDAVPHVSGPNARGSAVWNADGSGVFYTRYPRKGEQSEGGVSSDQQIYFHKLGTSAEQDAHELGKEFPAGAQIELQSSPDGRRILASIADNDRPRVTLI
jgi:prolyl oligopeptidase